MDTKEDTVIDESLYSRQMYVYGAESMGKICNSRVLLTTLTALGVEIAKNVILSGVKQLDIVRQANLVNHLELGANFYATEADIGKNVADVCLPKLRELNGYVSVNVLDHFPSREELAKYNVVVSPDMSIKQQVAINNLTHQLNVPFVLATTRGLTGHVFCDFGDSFPVRDVNGENVKESQISQTYLESAVNKEDPENPHVLWVVETSEPHDLSPGDWINLHHTQTGNTDGPYQVVKVRDQTFMYLEKAIPETPDFDPVKFSAYGETQEVKKTQMFNFKTYQDALANPDFIYSDFAHMNRPATLHLATQLLDTFMERYKRYPIPFNKDDMAKFLDGFQPSNNDPEKWKDYDLPLIQKFIDHGNGILVPVTSVIGSIASQEAMKAITNKYTPLHQFFYFESIDSLPEEVSDVNLLDTSRYSSIRAVFGNAFFNTLQKLKLFQVGDGAIGCELLKNFALMGVATDKEGVIVTTDPDIIEKSNLNRQFLFRPRNIGHFKSVAAAEAIHQMNPDVNIITHQHRVGAESESVYNTPFYSSLDLVVNALDNVSARRYVDSRCVLHGLPLLESGTLSTKGNVQVVIPHLSESYGSSHDPPDKEIPVCTLKNFPYQIEHTIQWARDNFEAVFVNPVQSITKFQNEFESLGQLAYGELQEVYDHVLRYGVQDVPHNMTDCIRVAIKHFVLYYHDTINALTTQYPPDATTGEGVPFWSGVKRFPQSIPFDPQNPLHRDYVLHFAFLYAQMYGLEPIQISQSEVEMVYQAMIANKTPMYPVHQKFSATEEEEKEQQATVAQSGTDMLLEKLAKLKLAVPISSLKPHDFEKDDDTNHHVDFVTCTSNMRASNYHIPLVDRHKTKGIAGRIIPAIATTTSLVAGLVSLELCKIVAKHTNLEKYRNAFVNLGLSMYAFSEPVPPAKLSHNGKEYTEWDHVDVKGDMKMMDFRQELETQFKTEVDSVMYGRMQLYSSFISPESRAERDETMMSKLLADRNVPLEAGNFVPIEFCLDMDSEDEFVEPTVRYFPIP